LATTSASVKAGTLSAAVEAATSAVAATLSAPVAATSAGATSVAATSAGAATLSAPGAATSDATTLETVSTMSPTIRPGLAGQQLDTQPAFRLEQLLFQVATVIYLGHENIILEESLKIQIISVSRDDSVVSESSRMVVSVSPEYPVHTPDLQLYAR
jgi:hypothetical protein